MAAELKRLQWVLNPLATSAGDSCPVDITTGPRPRLLCFVRFRCGGFPSARARISGGEENGGTLIFREGTGGRTARVVYFVGEVVLSPGSGVRSVKVL